ETIGEKSFRRREPDAARSAGDEGGFGCHVRIPVLDRDVSWLRVAQVRVAQARDAQARRAVGMLRCETSETEAARIPGFRWRRAKRMITLTAPFNPGRIARWRHKEAASME